jgi:hypothetical protein
MAGKSGSKVTSKEMFNEKFTSADGTEYAVVNDVRAPRESIQTKDRFYIPEYAAIIAQPYTFTGTNGEDVTIMTAERIPAVKLDRKGNPVKGTVLWVSQLCPQDVNKVYAFDDELNDERQDGNLLAAIKGQVVTAVEHTTIMARVWDDKNGGYKMIDEDTYASAPKVVFRWSHAAPATSLDLDAADALLKKYLDDTYPGLLA